MLLIALVAAMVALFVGVRLRYVLYGLAGLLVLNLLGSGAALLTGSGDVPTETSRPSWYDPVPWESEGIPEPEEPRDYVEDGFGHCVMEVDGVKRYNLPPDAPGYDKDCDFNLWDP